MKKIIITLSCLSIASYAVADAPTSWRDFMSPPHVQTEDGFCPTYAALHCVEGLYNYYCELSNYLEISEDQYLFDDEPLEMEQVFDDIKDHRVIPKNEGLYPNLQHSYFSIASHGDIPSTATNGYSNNNRLDNLLEHLGNWGPVSLEICGYSNIKNYVENQYDPDSTNPQFRIPATLTVGGTGEGDFHCVVVVDSGYFNNQLYLECFNSYHTEDDHFFKIFTDTQNFEIWAGEVEWASLHERTYPYDYDRISESDPNINFYYTPKIYPYLNKFLRAYDNAGNNVWGDLQFFAEDEEIYIVGNTESNGQACTITWDDQYPEPNISWPDRVKINIYKDYTGWYENHIVVESSLKLVGCDISPFGNGYFDGYLCVDNSSLYLDDVLINDLEYGIYTVGIYSSIDADSLTITNTNYGIYLDDDADCTLQNSNIGLSGNDIAYNRLIQGGYGAIFTLRGTGQYIQQEGQYDGDQGTGFYHNNITYTTPYYALANDYEEVEVGGNFWDTNDNGDRYYVFKCYPLTTGWEYRLGEFDEDNGAPLLKIAAPSSFEMARYYEANKDWTNAKYSYMQAIVLSDDSMLSKRATKGLLHIYKEQGWQADDLRIITRNNYDKALNKHKPTFDYLYNETYVAEGNYFTAIDMFEKCADKYAGTSVEVRMLSRIANIYGDYLDNPAAAKRYADRAAALNPGQPILFSAYWSAGIEYNPEDYSDKFEGVLEYYDIPEEHDAELASGSDVTVTPNPFNPSTVIGYTLTNPSRVELSIYSITGQKVATLVNGNIPAGRHSVTFDGANLASGIYFYRFESAALNKTGKLMLMK